MMRLVAVAGNSCLKQVSQSKCRKAFLGRGRDPKQPTRLLRFSSDALSSEERLENVVLRLNVYWCREGIY